MLSRVGRGNACQRLCDARTKFQLLRVHKEIRTGHFFMTGSLTFQNHLPVPGRKGLRNVPWKRTLIAMSLFLITPNIDIAQKT